MIQEKELLTVNYIPCGSYNRYFITLNGNHITSENELLEEYERLYQCLLDHRIIPVYEKIFGNYQSRDLLLQTRNQLLNWSFPSSYINYPTVNGQSILSSVFVYGVEIIDEHKCSINLLQPNVIELSADDVKHIYMTAFQAPQESMEKGKVYENLFGMVEQCFNSIGYQPRNIVRTWYYMSEMNDNYKSFNTARNNFFIANGISYDENANRLPSSTCIGANIPGGKDIHMDIYCISQSNDMPIIKRVYNEKQNEANGTSYLFQSTFARATEITTDHYTEMQISGTASIDVNGASIYIGDSFNQIVTTLQNVLALLQQYQMDFSHMVQSTCFFKKKEYYEDFLKALDFLKIAPFSSTFVEGDVCRDDLLFELDGIAVKPRRAIFDENRGSC